MIQDILPRHFDNQWRDIVPEPGDTCLVCHDNTVLCRRLDDGTILFPSLEDLHGDPTLATYLFSIDQEKFFLLPHLSVTAPVGYAYEDMRVFRQASPRYYAFAGITGHQLYQWYREHRFCGRCSGALVKDHKERMLKCPHCGTVVYPVICPAVIVAVVDKDRILLSKYAGRGPNPRYALVAGFNEIGETIEETVHREVMEEVGLKVKNLQFYKSQPWSFSGSLLFGFFAELDGSDEITLQEDELSEAAFHTADEVPENTEQVALTWEMMEKFRNGYRPYGSSKITAE